MDEAIAWFRHFLDVEWAAKTAYHLEEDLDTFLASKRTYQALKHKKAGERLNRWDPPKDSMKKEYEREAKRVLFAVRPVTADGEDAWAFYTSNHMNLDVGRAMDVLFVVLPVDGGFTVASQYEACSACDATGHGGSCSTCGGLGFVHDRGLDLDPVRTKGDAITFEAPTHAMSSAAYEAL